MRKIHRNFILASATAFFFFTSMSFFLLLPKFIHQLGGKKGEIGLIMGASGFASCILIPLTGIIAEKLGRKKIALTGILGASIVAFLYICVKSMDLPLLITLRIFQGTFFAFSFVSCASFAGDFSPPGRKSEFLGYFGIAILSPNMIGPYLGEKIIEMSFDFLFMASAFSGCIASIIALFFANDQIQPEKVEKKTNLIEFLKFLKYLLSLSFILGCLFSTTFFFLPIYSVEKGIEKVGIFYTAYTLTAIVIRFLLGSVSEKIEFHKRTPVLFFLISVAIMLIARMNSISSLILSAIIYGFGEGLAYPSINGEVLNRAPNYLINVATGFYIGAFNLGTLLAPITFGYFSQLYSFKTAFFGTSLFPLFGILLILLDYYKGQFRRI